MARLPFDLDDLRAFLAVAEALSFTRAARSLGVAQPPLSRRIAQLEQRLGTRLLDRSSRRVQLTPAGRRFAQDARRLMAEAGLALTRLGLADDVGQRLALGHSPSCVFHPAFAGLLRRLRAERPGLRIELVEAATAELASRLEEGSLDAALLRGHGVWPARGQTLVLLDEEPLIAAVPVAHPLAARPTLSLAEALGDAWIGPDPAGGSALAQILDDHAARLGSRPALRASGVAALIRLAAAGLGIAVVPQGVAGWRDPAVRLIELTPPAPTLPLYLARPERRDEPPGPVDHVEALAEAVVAAYQRSREMTLRRNP
jgi:DNA-binding transcriptional LysR family regulator